MPGADVSTRQAAWHSRAMRASEQQSRDAASDETTDFLSLSLTILIYQPLTSERLSLAPSLAGQWIAPLIRERGRRPRGVSGAAAASVSTGFPCVSILSLSLIKGRSSPPLRGSPRARLIRRRRCCWDEKKFSYSRSPRLQAGVEQDYRHACAPVREREEVSER